MTERYQHWRFILLGSSAGHCGTAYSICLLEACSQLGLAQITSRCGCLIARAAAPAIGSRGFDRLRPGVVSGRYMEHCTLVVEPALSFLDSTAVCWNQYHHAASWSVTEVPGSLPDNNGSLLAPWMFVDTKGVSGHKVTCRDAECRFGRRHSAREREAASLRDENSGLAGFCTA